MLYQELSGNPAAVTWNGYCTLSVVVPPVILVLEKTPHLQISENNFLRGMYMSRSFVFDQVNVTFLSKNLVLFTLARIQNYGLIMYEVLLTLGTTFLR
jgi:hypothetical protein